MNIKEIEKPLCIYKFEEVRIPQYMIQFFSFVIFANGINIKDKKIELVKTWQKSRFIRDILIFFDFRIFYKKFIKHVGRIVISLIFMLQTTGNN